MNVLLQIANKMGFQEKKKDGPHFFESWLFAPLQFAPCSLDLKALWNIL
jgi:hypothetical protein